MIFTEKELIEHHVQCAKQGNKESIELLYSAFLPYILTLANKIFIPDMDKEDIKQECFISLVTAIEKYKGSNTFIAYVTQSMKNNLYYKLRHNTKIKAVPLDSVVGPVSEPIENTILNKIDLKRLSGAIKSLSPLEQAILQDYYFNDLSLLAIADKNHLKYITTAKKKDRAILKAKKMLVDED